LDEDEDEDEEDEEPGKPRAGQSLEMWLLPPQEKHLRGSFEDEELL